MEAELGPANALASTSPTSFAASIAFVAIISAVMSIITTAVYHGLFVRRHKLWSDKKSPNAAAADVKPDWHLPDKALPARAPLHTAESRTTNQPVEVPEKYFKSLMDKAKRTCSAVGASEDKENQSIQPSLHNAGPQGAPRESVSIAKQHASTAKKHEPLPATLPETELTPVSLSKPATAALEHLTKAVQLFEHAGDKAKSQILRAYAYGLFGIEAYRDIDDEDLCKEVSEQLDAVRANAKEIAVFARSEANIEEDYLDFVTMGATSAARGVFNCMRFADRKAAEAFDVLGREELGLEWSPYPGKRRAWSSRAAASVSRLAVDNSSQGGREE